VLQEWAGKVTL
jgi:hypothetical protein